MPKKVKTRNWRCVITRRHHLGEPTHGLWGKMFWCCTRKGCNYKVRE